MREHENKTNFSFEKVRPTKEIYQDNFHWFYFNEHQTGLPLIALEDLKTGLTVSTILSVGEQRNAALKAWSGARQSRAPGTPWEIMSEIVEKNVNSDQKMTDMVNGYGHASVGDMASLQVDLTNVPMHLCFNLFNISSINSGQEKSTRYQSKFGGAILHPLKNYLGELLDDRDKSAAEIEYAKFGELSLANFAKYKEIATTAFSNFFKPEATQKNSLDSRVLDTVRSFLLFGQLGGMSFETTARDFSRIIGELKSSPVSYYQSAGMLIENILAPSTDIEQKIGFKAEAPGLIRHTNPSPIANQNLSALKDFLQSKNFGHGIYPNSTFRGQQSQDMKYVGREYSEMDKVVTQYILTLYPGYDWQTVLKQVSNMNSNIKPKISEIIFRNHSNYNELPPIDRTTSMTLVMEAALGEIRDLNRQRALGRFIPLPAVYGLPMTADTAYQVLGNGYVLPLYVTDVPQLTKIGRDMTVDMNKYYSEVYKFVGMMERKFGDGIDYSFVMNLLPMAHKFNFWMHADPKQAVYMPDRRVKPGGHINYRDLAYLSNQLIADSDQFFSALRFDKRPDPANREEFFDRS